MLLYGASGHAMVILDLLLDSNKRVIHVFDDDDSKTLFNHITVSKYDKDKFPEEDLIISIGNNKLRKEIADFVQHRFGAAIHSSSIVSNKAFIDIGSVVLHNATIQANTKIGKHCIINTSASVDHECSLGDFVHISPNATLCGNVTIGEGTHVGAGAIILPNIKIGKWTKIGAGSVVVKNIPDNAICIGNPGRIKRGN